MAKYPTAKKIIKNQILLRKLKKNNPKPNAKMKGCAASIAENIPDGSTAKCSIIIAKSGRPIMNNATRRRLNILY